MIRIEPNCIYTAEELESMCAANGGAWRTLKPLLVATGRLPRLKACGYLGQHLLEAMAAVPVSAHGDDAGSELATTDEHGPRLLAPRTAPAGATDGTYKRRPGRQPIIAPAGAGPLWGRKAQNKLERSNAR